ncbi:MAG: hypothetical protein VW270_30410, partial [Candidatus Poseidoniales archaeon]
EKKDAPPFDVSKADYAGAAKELTQYAKKSGGVDKNDFLGFANRMSAIAGKKSPRVTSKFARDLQDLDTDVREVVIRIMRKNGIKVTMAGGGLKIEDFDIEQLEALELEEAPEDDEPASPDEGSMATQQLEFIEYAAEQIGDHIDNGGNFPEWMQNKLSTVNDNMQSLYSQIDHDDDEEEMDEAVNMDKVRRTYSNIMKGNRRGQPDDNEVGDYIPKGMTKADIAALIKMLAKQGYDAKYLTKDLAPLAEAKRDPSKSGGTGYNLYHKDFSSAMKHAYDYAKSKLGVEIDPKEIDDKVASGPRKPSKGKTNTYRLKGKDGKKAVQIQVHGMDSGKYELNMYKESVELDEAFTTAIKFPNYFKIDKKERDKIINITSKNPNFRGKISSQIGKDGSVTIDGDATTMRKIEAALKKAGVKFVATESVEEGRVYVKTPEGDAYDAGKKAVAKGISYDKNPNKKGTKEYLAWSKGHNDARATKISNKHFGQPRLKREEAEMTEEVNLDELFESAFEELEEATYQVD